MRAAVLPSGGTHSEGVGAGMTVEREDCAGPAGRARPGNADWLTGARVTAVLGVYYRPEGRAGEPEAVEFVLAEDQSVLLDLRLRPDAACHPGQLAAVARLVCTGEPVAPRAAPAPAARVAQHPRDGELGERLAAAPGW
ncbi:hypothetical protein SBADM41S_11851 [Streptomyces badius]